MQFPVATLVFVSLLALAAFTYLGAADLGDDGERVRIYAVGVFVAILTFVLSEHRRALRQRQQHTISVLFDTRFSETLRSMLRRRERHLKPGVAVTRETYLDITQSDPAASAQPTVALDRKRSLRAAIDILNYYEYLALGIERGDLDGAMLKKALRGIMCAFVRDMRHVVEYEQGRNPRAWEHLTRLYNDWRADGDPKVGRARYRGPLDGLRLRLAEAIAPR